MAVGAAVSAAVGVVADALDAPDRVRSLFAVSRPVLQDAVSACLALLALAAPMLCVLWIYLLPGWKGFTAMFATVFLAWVAITGVDGSLRRVAAVDALLIAAGAVAVVLIGGAAASALADF